MPLHDWTRVDAGLYHDFHQSWTVALCNALNGGLLPSDYFAMLERRISGPIPDVLTLELPPTEDGARDDAGEAGGGLAVATAPPRTDVVCRTEAAVYAGRANRITVRHRHGRVVAVVEVVSPGNKSGVHEFRTFIEKSADLIGRGVHLLVIDPFPPGPRDPQGLPKMIWEEFAEEDVDDLEDLAPPPGRARTIASFDAGASESGAPRVAYVSFVGAGNPLPDMPLFLRPGIYVQAPLEASYQTAWEQFPRPVRGLLTDAKDRHY